jgi:cytochrome c556
MKSHAYLRKPASRLVVAALAALAVVGGGPAWSQTAAVSPDANGYIPQATIAEIMDAIVMPAAQSLWDAVAVDVTEQGTIEKAPQTDDDWAQLRATAVTLAEATNALIVPGRHAAPPGTASDDPDAELAPEKIDALLAKERPAWIAHAHVLHEAAMEALRAVDARSIDGVSEAGGTIDAACEGCHLQFWYPEQP